MKTKHIKETDLTRSFASVVDHLKNHVRNNVVTAHKRSLVRDLEDKQVKQICNIVDSSIEEAASQAIGAEARSLMKLIEKEIKLKTSTKK